MEAQAGSTPDRVVAESWQGVEMIPTKTYPLSAIMGEEMTDKERIAELEAEVTMRREQAEGLQNQWVKDTQKIVALEAEVKMLRESGISLVWYTTNKHAGNPVQFDSEKRDAYLRIAELLQAAIVFKNYADDLYNKDPRSCAIINTPIQQRLWLAIDAVREGK